MYRFQAEKECERRNRPREVRFVGMGSANAAGFWSRCKHDANFFITGGSGQQRADMLVQMLRDFRGRPYANPVILLTGSPAVEAAVVVAAQKGFFGPTVVSSSKYRNYYPLYNLDPAYIVAIFSEIARNLNHGELDSLENYIRAFLAIAERKYGISLASFLRLDAECPSNHQLVALGQTLGVRWDYLQTIQACPQHTLNLRSILQRMAEAYQTVSVPGFIGKTNLQAAVEQRKLICLNVQSLHPQTMDMVLAAELKQIMLTQRQFLLILNDVPLNNPAGLFEQVARAKNSYEGASVGLCTQNLYGWASGMPQSANAEETLLKNNQNAVLFHNGSDTDANMSGVLCHFGKYTKYEPVLGGRHKGLTPAVLSDDWDVALVGERNRVAPEDLSGYGVLLQGHHGRRIDLYRSITVEPTMPMLGQGGR